MKKIILILLTGLIISLSAATIYVNDNAYGLNNGTSWANAYNSFQTALNSSVSGDQIWVASGTYKPSQSYDLPNISRYYHFRMKSGVAIYGGFNGTETAVSQRTNFAHGGSNETALSGDIGTENDNTDNCYHVFYHPSGLNLYSTAILDGFTITAGNGNGTSPHFNGGGMYNVYCSVKINNCEFISNSAYFGGGIYNQGASPDMTGCRFTGNSANMSGGGMYSSTYDSFPLVKYCTFTSNNSGSGGAIYSESSLLHVNYSEFSGNSATNNGGGIYCGGGSSFNLNNSSFTGNTSAYGGALYSVEGSSYDIVNCGFTSNSVSHSGGAVYNNDVYSSASIQDCLFKSNNAGSGGGIYNDASSSPDIGNSTFEGNTAGTGGGMCNASSSPTVTNCFFTSNSATVYYGGGMHNSSANPSVVNCIFKYNSAERHGGGIDSYNSGVTVTNCTFSLNSSEYGGGVYAYDSYINLNNCIIWGNQASSGGNEIGMVGNILQNYTTTLNYSCYGNSAGDIHQSGGTLNTPNSITSDPGMLQDFRLPGISPCVNTGKNSYNTETLDILGRNRIQNSVIDMGAYEWTEGTDPEGNIFYVDQSASGANTGFSWTDAFTSLQPALDIAGQGCDVWVAEGTYKPSSFYDLEIFYNDTTRNYHFRMINGVGIYGGFEGGETEFAQRNIIENETVLSADIGIEGNISDNCYHVIYNTSQTPAINSTAVLDGFTITGGNADGNGVQIHGGGMRNSSSSPSIFNCKFIANKAEDGGGMYNSGACSPIVTNCLFVQNYAGLFGGGVYIGSSSSPSFTNCEFRSNTAYYGGAVNNDEASQTMVNCLITGNTGNYGGAFCNLYGILSMTNCTISGNNAVTSGEDDGWGGAFCNMASEVTLNNSILWGNEAVIGDEIFIMALGTETTALNYSCYSNEPGDIEKYDANGVFLPDAYCITADPAFVDPAAGDLRLYGYSPAVNTGKNFYNLLYTDLRGEARVQNTTIDIGAYEWTAGTDPADILAPSNLTIIRGSSTTLLSWTAVSGASSYKVYRSTDPYGTFSLIDTITSITYTDDDVLIGNKYFYYVVAVRAK